MVGRKRSRLLVSALTLTLLAAACGSDKKSSDAPATTAGSTATTAAAGTDTTAAAADTTTAAATDAAAAAEADVQNESTAEAKAD